MLECGGLGDDAQHVPGLDDVALGDAGLKRPGPLAVESRHVHPAREHRSPERVVVNPGEHLERTLRAVEDAAEQAWAQLDLERPARIHDGLAGPQSGRVLVHLDRDPVPVQTDHLTG